uniref:SPRY domain-containing protein n=1 Tax=Meloidogyne hapla TaxID=6305 RepID=A0A1I8BA66_MELHA
MIIYVNSFDFPEKSFVQIKNKWKDIGGEDCCTNKCINTDKPVGNCIEGNGFINIINDENIKYINRVEGKDNRYPVIYTEDSFMKPRYCLNHNLFYFEYKCKFEGKNKWMFIGLKNCNSNKYIYYCTCYNKIYNEKNEGFKVQQNIWNDNDIFGCGLVYPPNNNKNENPYVFFTKNGKQVGKALLLKENFDLYKPFVELYCCSVEANFGNDLTTKPFSYDISEKA